MYVDGGTFFPLWRFGPSLGHGLPNWGFAVTLC